MQNLFAIRSGRIFKLLIFLLISASFGTSVFAESGWVAVRSDNFNLVGNADEKRVETVLIKLEQFRFTVKKLFPELNCDSQVPINVLIFKDQKSFKEFAPLDETGKRSDWVGGYYQPGEFGDHITLAFGANEQTSYQILFHEYAHFLVKNNYRQMNLPTWFNEGFAEYFEQFSVNNKRKFTIGEANQAHLEILKKNPLIPAKEFFEINNNSLRSLDRQKVHLYYAQAWALMHFLMQRSETDKTGKNDEFLKLLKQGKSHETAFREAFGMNYEEMQQNLSRYILRKNFASSDIKFDKNVKFDLNSQSKEISLAEVNVQFANLFLSQQRYDEAEIYLKKALAENSVLPEANLSMASLELKRENYAEAKKYLEKILQTANPNYLAFYKYAFVLSREKISADGFITSFDKADSAKMKFYLRKAIEANPVFTESYNLFALISTVNNEELDTAIELMKTAIKLAPENDWYQMRLADLYARKKNFTAARIITEKILLDAIDENLKRYAANTLSMLGRAEQTEKNLRTLGRKSSAYIQSDEPISEEDFERIKKLLHVQGINEALSKPAENEKRILGNIISIKCEDDKIIFQVTAENRSLKFKNTNLQNLKLKAFAKNTSNRQIGCGLILENKLSSIIYKPFEINENEISGEIIAIEFVPDNFRYLEDKD